MREKMLTKQRCSICKGPLGDSHNTIETGFYHNKRKIDPFTEPHILICEDCKVDGIFDIYLEYLNSFCYTPLAQSIKLYRKSLIAKGGN